MYQPTLESIRQHPVPDWYNDAKFGIFIHWTISSVPAFAPTGLGDMHKMMLEKPVEYLFTNQPYAEWYQNSLRIADSPVSRYHQRTYGANSPYEGFAQTFNEQSLAWDPDYWAELFHRAGARYAVLVTKHHDGFLLWPSKTPNPRLPGYHAVRDIPGELARSISRQGLKLGLYYSSALDWTFTSAPIRSAADLLTSGPVTKTYTDYVEHHWLELIDRYQPWLLWSDIGYPPNYPLPRLFASYYNCIPEGVVNDRWGQIPGWLRNPAGRWIINQAAAKMIRSGGPTGQQVPHCDYITTEYSHFGQTLEKKWEAVRGIGNSFAYNQFEAVEDYLRAPQLIRMLADIVSKNGNLLLNIGPRPDGSIPAPQVEALEGIGQWLNGNGEAIYGTRPWVRSGDTNQQGMEVFYTQQGNNLYVIVSSIPSDRVLRLPEVKTTYPAQVTHLSTHTVLACMQEDTGLVIPVPEEIDCQSIPVFRLQLA